MRQLRQREVGHHIVEVHHLKDHLEGRRGRETVLDLDQEGRHIHIHHWAVADTVVVDIATGQIDSEAGTATGTMYMLTAAAVTDTLPAAEHLAVVVHTAAVAAATATTAADMAVVMHLV